MTNNIYFVCEHCYMHSDGFDAHELGCADCNTPAIHFILTRVDEEEGFGYCDYCNNDLEVTGYKVQEIDW